MTDYSELMARLRFCASNPGYDEIALSELSAAADALEAQARIIDGLRVENEQYAQANEAQGREISELIGMREEVLHYQREFHRMRDKLADAVALLPIVRPSANAT